MAERKQQNPLAGNLPEDNRPFLEKYSKAITGAVSAVLVVVGIYMAYTYLYKQPLEKEAAESMFQAQFQFERDSFELALANPGSGYRGFLEISDKYSSTAAGNLALYYAGISYLHIGEYDAAVEYLKDFSPAGNITPIMKHGALGDAYSELGDFDRALSSYSKAVTYDNDYLSPYYLLKKGRLEMNLGKSGDSLKSFNQLKDKYPNSSFAANADKFITMLK